jgi:hypothetical protein
MSNLHRSALLSCALLALTAPGAGAAKPPKLPHISFRFYRVVSVSGTERVDFAGDQAAGCAAHGVCGISGTATYTPRAGSRSVADYVSAGSIAQEGQIIFGSGTTSTTVTTAGADAACTDTLAVHAATATLARQGDQVRAVLHDQGEALSSIGANDGVFATHCAGPRAADLTAGLPNGQFPVAKLKSRTIALEMRSDNAPFSGAGFAGHVTSDIRVTLRRDKSLDKLVGSIGDVLKPS